MFAEILPDAHFIAPNAPEPCDMAPYGYQWFSLQEWTPESKLRGTKASAPALNAFLDAQLARFSLPDSALALIGFSQGTMMSLYAAPRRANPIAGIVGYSGALIGSETLANDITAKPPVCLIHGEADTVVPFAAMEHARASLSACGVTLEAHARPNLPHSIDEEGIILAGAFLLKCFGLQL
jgi:phospholipase/carboxylesterase